MLLAFLRLAVHHNSRSSGIELFELFELRIDGATEGVKRSFSLSLANLSFRSPTFSVSGSVQDKSAENILLECGRKERQRKGRTNVQSYSNGGEEKEQDSGYHTN